MSDALKTGEATILFGPCISERVTRAFYSLKLIDYLADSVDAFLTDSGYEFPDADDSDHAPINLGLTFSFPVEQTALDKGILLTWTKGFAAKNAIGNDIVGLLQDAFNRKHLHVRCVALVNDVSRLRAPQYWRIAEHLVLSRPSALYSRVPTLREVVRLVSCDFHATFGKAHPSSGAIFGTGTNGAYVEDLVKITKLKNDDAAALGGKMIVNTEWGAFNNSVRAVLPNTDPSSY